MSLGGKRITDDICIVDNMPLRGDLHYGDIVRLDSPWGDGIPTVKEVLLRQCTATLTVQYEHDSQFHAFVTICSLLGGHVEGYMGPRADTPGQCSVAFDPERFDAALIARALKMDPCCSHGETEDLELE
jgi:hypothetical protein